MLKCKSLVTIKKSCKLGWRRENRELELGPTATVLLQTEPPVLYLVDAGPQMLSTVLQSLDMTPMSLRHTLVALCVWKPGYYSIGDPSGLGSQITRPHWVPIFGSSRMVAYPMISAGGSLTGPLLTTLSLECADCVLWRSIIFWRIQTVPNLTRGMNFLEFVITKDLNWSRIIQSWAEDKFM